MILIYRTLKIVWCSFFCYGSKSWWRSGQVQKTCTNRTDFKTRQLAHYVSEKTQDLWNDIVRNKPLDTTRRKSLVLTTYDSTKTLTYLWPNFLKVYKTTTLQGVLTRNKDTCNQPRCVWHIEKALRVVDSSETSFLIGWTSPERRFWLAKAASTLSRLSHRIS